MSLLVPIVALGLMASLSPTTIVVFIMLLTSSRPRVNGAAFLIGWVASLVLVFALSYALGGAHQLQVGSGRVGFEVVEVLLGLALVVAGARQWRHRHRSTTASGMSRTLSARLEGLKPAEAVVVGVLKEPWALTTAAAVVVIRQHSALPTTLVALLLFAVISTASVGLTFLYFSRRPGQAQRNLDRLRERAVQAAPTIAAVLGMAVGLYLAADGVAALLGWKSA